MKRKVMSMLEPGDVVMIIEGKKFVGPRGGRYTFRELVFPRSSGATFSSRENWGENEFVFKFENAQQLRIDRKLSHKLRVICQGEIRDGEVAQLVD